MPAPTAPDADPGVDHTALVQEYIAADEGRITRVEVLNGRYLYAIRIYSSGDTFNLCPADVCQVGDAFCPVGETAPAPAPRFQIIKNFHDPIIERYRRKARTWNLGSSDSLRL